MLSIMAIRRQCDFPLQLLQRGFQSGEFMNLWLNIQKFVDYRALPTLQCKGSIVKYVVEDFRSSTYWTQWMLKRYTVTLKYMITEYNDTFDRIDSIQPGSAKKNTQLSEDLYITVRFTWQKMSKSYAEVTPLAVMGLISVQILKQCRNLWLDPKWHSGMDIAPEKETFYSTQYPETFPPYVDNECCAKRRRLPVTMPQTSPSNSLVPSSMASGSAQSTFHVWDLSPDNEAYWRPKYVVGTTPGWCDCATGIFTARRLDFKSLTE